MYLWQSDLSDEVKSSLNLTTDSAVTRQHITAAADAQVGGCVVRDTLEGDDDAVQEAFEGVDAAGVQVLVGIEERTTHHNEEQELEQHRQEALLGRRLA
ncbi:hypothetical protein EYF80_018069 [Liparis tanakae]|uniref:Uncharacterized protein n=1 Tax=Liparis tanakae TaxID=230148 RepID=A0A4Z2I1C4_9TELE|nr:hypothetical protein EYF80_018069 [Liparis tanakae]